MKAIGHLDGNGGTVAQEESILPDQAVRRLIDAFEHHQKTVELKWGIFQAPARLDVRLHLPMPRRIDPLLSSFPCHAYPVTVQLAHNR